MTEQTDQPPATTAATPTPAAATPVSSDPRHERALSIYARWRNLHLADLPVEVFHRIEHAAEHLIAAIKKEL
jgi:hypothetical protein